MATLLMTVILGALATVTAQWLPNWNRAWRGCSAPSDWRSAWSASLADLSVAEMIPSAATAKRPLFEGSELSVTFVRTAVGPNTRPASKSSG
jgi:general secretion pathway protein J